MDSYIINGVCRCCASQGSSKDIDSTYTWMGDEEIYSKMLRDCFDIALERSEDGHDGGICELCVTQLRNAFNFKKQVVNTEEMLRKRLSDPFKHDVKLELPREDLSGSDNDAADQNMADDDDTSVKDFLVPIKMEVEVEAAADPAPAKPKRGSRSGPSSAKKPKLEAETSKNQTWDEELACHLCDRPFSTLFNLKRHMKMLHKREADVSRKTICEACGKVLHNKKWLAKHLSRGCSGRSANVCVRCDITFATKQDMARHYSDLHWSEPKRIHLQCPLCDISFDGHEALEEHLFSGHEIEMDYREKRFDRLEGLTEWKRNIENKDGVHFLRSSKNADCYHCHPISQLTNDQTVIVITCPARIQAVTKDDGACVATYQSKHICKRNGSKLFCPLCSIGFERSCDMYRHLADYHDVQIEDKKLSFDSYGGAVGGVKRMRLKKGKNKKWPMQSATPERLDHRVNLTTILQHSTAAPFRDKTRHGFSCLYCAQYFQNIDDLRAHTAQQSEKDKINTMVDYKLSYNPIKVDITDLQCTLCGLEIKDLTELKEHLVDDHGKVIHKDIKDIILPFELRDGTNFTCVICSMVNSSFKNLYQHMSIHYRNYCCDECGAGYICIAALRKHKKTHQQGNFPCDFCDKIFTSFSKKRNHEKGVHTGGWLRNKCPYCPEIFVSYYDRNAHLVKEHNAKPVTHACNACNKVYKKKYELSRHIKHHHLQQKNYTCDSCNASFFSKRGLIDHMTRHMGGVTWTCDICGKSFSRQRTLKEHSRTHADDKKYECEVCKKTFMQKCSLKSHIRLHQDDLDIFKEFDDVKHLIDNRDLTLKQIAAEAKMKDANLL